MRQTFAELDINVSRLHGMGGADYPQLRWQTELAFLNHPAPQNDYAFRTVSAQLYSLHQKIADSRPIFLHRIIRGRDAYLGNELLDFEFPLDFQRIQALENLRQGGSRTLHPRLRTRDLASFREVLTNCGELWQIVKLRAFLLAVAHTHCCN
jgi:hypothetical protein